MSDDIVIMAIKPKYAKAIYSGDKCWEFRKAPPPLYRLVFIYESAPVSAITGTCVFTASVSGLPYDVLNLLRKVSQGAPRIGISESELAAYAAGRSVTALYVDQATPLDAPVHLAAHPPQNWCRLQSLRAPGNYISSLKFR